jgi:hypothetical protein
MPTSDNSPMNRMQQIADISARINRLTNELRPISESIKAGKHDGTALELSNRIQTEIGALDKQLGQLRNIKE